MESLLILAIGLLVLVGILALVGVYTTGKWLLRFAARRKSSSQAEKDKGYTMDTPAQPETDKKPPKQWATAGAMYSPQEILRTPLVRFGIVAVIGLLLLWPLMMVSDIVRERSGLYASVVREISKTWGGEQQVSGPVLVIPFMERQLTERTVRTADGKEERIKDSVIVLNHLVILPNSMDFSTEMAPQGRQRGIYRSLVYTADMKMKGVFTLPSHADILRLAPATEAVDYDRAFVVVGLSYPSALRDVGAFLWNKKPLKAEPGVQPFSPLTSGFRIPAPLTPNLTTYDFSQNLTLNGSGGIRFTPVGESTSITIASSWPHPSFQGSVLPATRDVTDTGFTATWHIPSLARSYPNFGTLSDWPQHFDNFSVGVDLYETSTHYHLIERSVKYGSLFIGLTFLALIIFEMALQARLHPVQYGLVGLSMIVFYLVLLSLSEHLAFLQSYAAASGCTLLMITLYVGAALRNAKKGLGIGLLLLALYALLYAILQMEDYALLMGTTLVLVMLGALMVVSRHLNVAGE